jgi:site-specific DNA recombinase
MIAAIYARKSTEQNGVTEEEKSVTRQIEHARAYAAKKGWLVSDDHVYLDDGISGAEFVKRPGFLRLMNALKPRPSFQALIMSEESRLGREQIETAYALKQIMDAGVRVFFYLEDRERTLDSAMDKVMLSLTNFAAEMERERARQRTYDAMARKARALHVTGGSVYGYDNLEVLSPERGQDGRRKRLYVVRKVNRDQAAVVRRIFEMYAAGKGLTKIAKALNAERVPGPRRDGKGWAPSAVREMLHRPLYRGEIVWNKSQKVVRGGTKKQQTRPEGDWLRLEAPELRIISEELWQAVHARLAKAGAALPRTRQGGKLLGRPSYLDGDSPYLLMGFTACSICGGPVGTETRMHGTGSKRWPVRHYRCLTSQKRGDTVCGNRVTLRQELLDQAVLGSVSEVLDERIMDAAVDRALERLRTGHEKHLDRKTQVERELSLIAAQERRLVEAIKRGEAPEALVAALKDEEQRKNALALELDGLTGLDRVASLDSTRIKRELKARVADVRALLGRHVPQARQMLRKLLAGKIDMEPVAEDGRRGYRFRGKLTFERLLSGEAAEITRLTVVAPRGFNRDYAVIVAEGNIRTA